MENIYHTIRGRTKSPRTLESISKDPLSAAKPYIEVSQVFFCCNANGDNIHGVIMCMYRCECVCIHTCHNLDLHIYIYYKNINNQQQTYNNNTIFTYDDAVGQMLDKNTMWSSGDIRGIPPCFFKRKNNSMDPTRGVFLCCSDDGISRRSLRFAQIFTEILL